MSEESPRFNEIMVQPSPTKTIDYKFQLDRGESEVKDLPDDVDKKLIGFESVDELFSSLRHPQLINKHENQQIQTKNKPVNEIPLQRISSVKKPNITINYVQHPFTKNIIISSPSAVPLPSHQITSLNMTSEHRAVETLNKWPNPQFKTIQELAEPEDTCKQYTKQYTPQNILKRARSVEALQRFDPQLPINNTAINHRFSKINEEPIRRFVICQSYNFKAKRQERQELSRKMKQLKELERKIFESS